MSVVQGKIVVQGQTKLTSGTEGSPQKHTLRNLIYQKKSYESVRKSRLIKDTKEKKHCTLPDIT